MSYAENGWRRVRVDAQPDGGRVRLLSQVVEGVRVYREEHYTAATPEGDRALVLERYYTSDRGRAHRTLEAALAAASEPIETNEP